MHAPDMCDLLCPRLLERPPVLGAFARTCKAAHAAARPLLARARPRVEAERLMRHLGLVPQNWTNSVATFISIPYIARNHRIVLRERWDLIERRTTSVRRQRNAYFVMQLKTYPSLMWPNAVTWKHCRSFEELVGFMKMYTYAGFNAEDEPVGTAATPLFVRTATAPQTFMLPAPLQHAAS